MSMGTCFGRGGTGEGGVYLSIDVPPGFWINASHIQLATFVERGQKPATETSEHKASLLSLFTEWAQDLVVTSSFP